MPAKALCDLLGSTCPIGRSQFKMQCLRIGLPACTLEAPGALSICRGQTVEAPLGTPDGRLRLYDDAGVFLGVGTLEADGRIHSSRLLATESRAGGGSRDNPLN